MEAMKTFPIRLTPGQDLRAALEAAVQAQNCRAAEMLLALLPDWQFSREPDVQTGYDELVVRALS